MPDSGSRPSRRQAAAAADGACPLFCFWHLVCTAWCISCSSSPSFVGAQQLTPARPPPAALLAPAVSVRQRALVWIHFLAHRWLILLALAVDTVNASAICPAKTAGVFSGQAGGPFCPVANRDRLRDCREGPSCSRSLTVRDLARDQHLATCTYQLRQGARCARQAGNGGVECVASAPFRRFKTRVCKKQWCFALRDRLSTRCIIVVALS